MTASELNKNILNDMKVELLDEFDRNFERKAFFSERWPQRKSEGKGSLLVVRGGSGLRGSIRARVQNSGVVFSSGQPHAQIHNEGGDIVVTVRMKRFFWAKFYELSGKVKFKKDGKTSKGSLKISDEAEFYKNMALMKVGSKIHIPKRQFIGHAPEVDKAVKRIIEYNLKSIEMILKQGLK